MAVGSILWTLQCALANSIDRSLLIFIISFFAFSGFSFGCCITKKKVICYQLEPGN